MKNREQIESLSIEELRAELYRMYAGATIIKTASERVDPIETESCKWLIELPMTDVEMKTFKATFISVDKR